VKAALISLLAGAVAAVTSILLHQTLPPVGVIAGLIFTYITIWLVGRHFASRRLKWLAGAAWIVVIFRGALFGSGDELLVQADGVGSSLLLIGTLVVLAAIAARI
jgi:hypothetical protein